MNAPDLTAYDVILVNSSGGKDSQAMLDYVWWAAAALDVEDRIVVVHSDLGRVEWPGTAELAEEQAAHYGARFIKVTRPQGDHQAVTDHSGPLPLPLDALLTDDGRLVSR